MLRRVRVCLGATLVLWAWGVCHGFIPTSPLPSVGPLSGFGGRPLSTSRVRRSNGFFSFFDKPDKGDDAKKGVKPGADKSGKPVRSGFSNLGSVSPVKKASEVPSARGKAPKAQASVKASEEGPLEKVKTGFASVTQLLQTPVSFGSVLGKLAYLGVGFLGGAGAGIIFLLSPSGSLPDSIAQPITLFENILLEIDRSYVERVDDKKLFETAVESMLNSLDPYTEFEGEQLAKDMRESVSGRYGGVGLVIAGSRLSQPEPAAEAAVPAAANEAGDKDAEKGRKPDDVPPVTKAAEAKDKANGFRSGITVVSAFEGYAFDAGMRVGDRLISVDGTPVAGRSVDQVRDLLRGPPETQVKVAFERPGVPSDETGIELTLTRRLVRVPDVKLTTFLGPPEEGIGYVQLQGFSQGAPSELRLSLELLRLRAPNGLKGLILDLRNNPGGLLSSAVDVASLLVPQESEIVSAKGRNFPAVSYTSSLAPMRDNSVPLAVLVNSGTASAAEIVSGAVQDLDSGVIVGSDRTFGKGLVQNVESLPYNTALKYTVAKYYTPSGRCIQSVRYKPPETSKAKAATELLKETLAGGGYEASSIPDSERKEFRTKNGRLVRDGGGIEADVKVAAPQASVLEVTLLQQGAFFDYAGEWAKTHRYNGQGIHKSDEFITEQVYDEFKKFVYQQVDKGSLKLDLLFSGSLEPLDEALKETGYKTAKSDFEGLRKALRSEVESEFSSKKEQIKEQIQEAILARYLPESMLRRIALENDPQVKVALDTVKDRPKYQQILRQAQTDTALVDKDAAPALDNGLATTSGAGGSGGDEVDGKGAGKRGSSRSKSKTKAALDLWLPDGMAMT